MNSGKKRNSYFYGPNIAPKNYGFQKKELIVFRANILPKKVWVPKKKYEFQKKGTHTFSVPNIVPKKYGFQKKYEFQKKRNSSGRTLCQKKYGFQKKRNSYFFRAQHSAKKSMGSKKSMSSKKKELILFSGRTLCRKKYEFQKKRNSYFFRAERSARKKSAFLFFPELILFFGTYTFFGTMCGSKKVSMSSFFFGTLIFGALLFLAQCLARKKYEFLFFGIHTFISTMFGPNKYDVSLGTHPFFWNPYFLSGTMFGLKSMNSFFFWNPYFFWHYVGPEKVWVWVSIFLQLILFLALFFGTHTFFWHNFWPEKI